VKRASKDKGVFRREMELNFTVDTGVNKVIGGGHILIESAKVDNRKKFTSELLRFTDSVQIYSPGGLFPHRPPLRYFANQLSPEIMNPHLFPLAKYSSIDYNLSFYSSKWAPLPPNYKE